MAHPSPDPSYLADQYGTSERLRIRIETHAQYTVGEDDFETVELRHMRVAPRQVLLDAGCGPGRLARQLRGSGATLVGIDRSFGMLREASRLPASFAQADVFALPFADATFDRVAALGVLYHVRSKTMMPCARFCPLPSWTCSRARWSFPALTRRFVSTPPTASN